MEQPEKENTMIPPIQRQVGTIFTKGQGNTSEEKLWGDKKVGKQTTCITQKKAHNRS